MGLRDSEARVQPRAVPRAGWRARRPLPPHCVAKGYRSRRCTRTHLLRNEQECGHDKIVGSEGGLACAAEDTDFIGLVCAHRPFKPNRLIGAVSVAGAIGQGAPKVLLIAIRRP